MSVNNDRFFKVMVTLLIIAILATLAYRLTRKPGDRVTIPSMERFEVVDPQGQAVPFLSEVGDHAEMYCFVMTLSNCERCIYNGMTDIEAMKAAGKQVMVLVVNDWPQEVQGWSVHYAGTPVYSVSVASFYAAVQTPYLPVILTFKQGRLDGWRFITNT